MGAAGGSSGSSLLFDGTATAERELEEFLALVVGLLGRSVDIFRIDRNSITTSCVV